MASPDNDFLIDREIQRGNKGRWGYSGHSWRRGHAGRGHDLEHGLDLRPHPASDSAAPTR